MTDPDAPGLVLCHGCRQMSGPPGALCPGCGSRLRDPSAREPALAAGAIGLALVGIAIALQNAAEGVASVVGVIGFLALIGAAVLGAQAAGRVGPQRQASCCGCSCAVALLVVPTSALLLFSQGGPALAALALPAWLPLSWGLEGLRRYASSSTRTVPPRAARASRPSRVTSSSSSSSASAT